ncbi:glycoside hydrolase family 3 C-terminal domain-containing protein [Gracilibacillus boraciitolerans]|nr:glycoside hydrolase family 3 C-terminal domain-containing protein [Gracilibacillus boraciitolerans]
MVSEFEPYVEGLLVHFGVQDQALLDIVSGKAEPTGLLPMQMPINMKTVEEQYEDVPHDMAPYMDTDEHVYNFGFGLNWSGCIKDKRSSKYMR